MKASEEDLRVADKVLTGTYLSYDHKQSLRRHIATALTAARAEQREVDAAKCDAIVTRYEQLQSRLVGSGATEAGDKARVADECAAAIRAGKE